MFSQLSRQQIQLSKIWLSHFLVNMTKYPHAKNIHRVDPDKNVSQTDRQTDRQTDGLINRTDFIEPLMQRQRFDHVFQKLENKVYLNYLA